MLGIFPQDLISSFDACASLASAWKKNQRGCTFLVLLVLIVAHHCAEERLLFCTQLLGHVLRMLSE